MVLLLAGVALFISKNRLRQQMKELELRNRIATDLHDEVGSSLSSIHVLSNMATRQQENPAGPSLVMPLVLEVNGDWLIAIR